MENPDQVQVVQTAQEAPQEQKADTEKAPEPSTTQTQAKDGNPLTAKDHGNNALKFIQSNIKIENDEEGNAKQTQGLKYANSFSEKVIEFYKFEGKSKNYKIVALIITVLVWFFIVGPIVYGLYAWMSEFVAGIIQGMLFGSLNPLA